MEIDSLRKELLDKMIAERERISRMIGMYRRRLVNSSKNFKELGECICELNGKHDYEWILKES